MPSRVSYDPGIGAVVVRQKGVMTLEDYKLSTVKLIQLMDSKGVKKCLIDNIKLDNRATIFDIYELPAIYKELKLDRQTKAAVIAGKDSNMENYRFYETVCQNRGFDFRVFTDRNEAINWLEA